MDRFTIEKHWGDELASRLTMDGTEPALQWRREKVTDRDFLLRLFVSVRGPEFEELPAMLRSSLLEQQFHMQRSSYLSRYSHDSFGVIEHQGASIGKLYLAETKTGIHIVDLALLPDWRNRGIGTFVMKHLCTLAEQEKASVTLSVFAANPVLTLYRRIGFRQVAQNSGYLQMLWSPDEPQA